MSGENGEERRNPMPSGARAAGALWLALGVLGLAQAGWAWAIVEGAERAPEWLAFVLLSVGFLSYGVRTLRGRLRSITRTGTAFIVMAAAAVNVPFLDTGPFFDGTSGVYWRLAWIGGLSTAGIVALAVRADYKRWRDADGGASGPAGDASRIPGAE